MLGLGLRRSYSTTTTFVPPSSLRDVQNKFAARRSRPSQLPRPASPSFYTARGAFYDQVVSIESSIQYSRRALTSLHLLPLPPFARAALPPSNPIWKPKPDMEEFMHSPLTMAKYRRVLSLLNELDDYRRIASTAGCGELEDRMAEILVLFSQGARDVSMEKKPVKIDEFGRSYTVGRRKTSAARVWIIPAKQPAPFSVRTTCQDEIDPTPNPPPPDQSIEQLLGLTPPPTPVKPSTVLINNLPLSTYFALPADREKVVRPLKLAGVLGGYNVFALVRGGGMTGQSGAVAHGIAKGLAVHEPLMEEVLRKAKLLRRDPRMVERKKTGLAKARKRYAWVRR